jgi:hypothetical protein
VKSVIPAVVKREGHAVLNADDPLVHGDARAYGWRLVLFSTLPEGENELMEDHLAAAAGSARASRMAHS